MLPDKGWLVEARRVPSPHYDCRPDDENRPCWWCIILACPRRVWRSVDRCIIHRNDRSRRPSFFAEIAHLRVSAHCLIRRDGEIVQYVPFDKRAWHAGVSNYQGRERCNDFSIGIELEGTDTLAYTDAQYQQLAAVTRTLIACYPAIADNMTGHCNIAPDRKTDPGPAFDWPRFRALVALSSHKEMT